MKITKFGHCCLLIEEKGVRVLTDPGSYTTAQNDVKDVDVILITHEHGDHFHVESVKKILENNPDATIITNTSVDKLLREADIPDAIIIEDGQSDRVGGLSISGHGHQHVEIYKDISQVPTTSYMIGERLFCPGDSWHIPKIPVELLALPVAGPWCKVKDAIEFALEINPKTAFPVHDAQLNELGLKSIYTGATPKALQEKGINFMPLEIGKETEI